MGTSTAIHPGSGDVAYRVFHFGGRPVLAVPDSPYRLRRASVARFPATTWRRMMFRMGMRCAVLTGLDRLALRRTAEPLPDRGDAALPRCLSLIDEHLGPSPSFPTLVWPPQADRARLYVYPLDLDGRARAFVKVGLDDANVEFIRREVAALRRFEQSPPRSFRTPRVLHHHEEPGLSVTIFEAVPDGARPTAEPGEDRLRPILDELSQLSGSPIEQELDGASGPDWWQRFLGRMDIDDGFRNDLFQRLRSPVRLGFAHGDFGSNNILFDGDDAWLIDWEYADSQAPVLTDRLAFELGLHVRAHLADPVRGVRDFHARYLEGRPSTEQCDAMLALAFRISAGFEDALHMAREWDSIH